MLIVNKTYGVACPTRALTELLVSGADEKNRLFSNTDGFATYD